MNRNIWRLLFLAIAFVSVLLFSGCEDDDEAMELRVNKESFDFETRGGTGHLYVFTNRAWEMQVEGGEGWMRPEMRRGSTEGLVYLEVDTNWTVGAARVARLTIVSDGQKVGVTVTQAGLVPVLTVPNAVTFPFIGAEKGITISSNIAWTIKNAGEVPSWLKLDVTSGDPGLVVMNAKVEEETEERKEFVLVVSAAGVEDQKVVVVQEAPAGIHEANVQPTDDLGVKIAAASEGDSLFLAAGTYAAVSKIVVCKGIVIAAAHPFKKPVIEAVFEAPNSCGDITFKNVILSGKGDASYAYCFRFMTESNTYGVLTLDGCEMKDYERALIYGDKPMSVGGVVIHNCVVTNIKTNGSDGIDFRKSDVAKIELSNSTFNNMAPERDFLRVDAASGNGLRVKIDHCTIYGCSAKKKHGLFYIKDSDVRTVFTNNVLVKCTPIGSCGTFEGSGNFYSEVDGSWLTIDKKGMEADPQFKDAANGDFTVNNGDIRTAKSGDPRWVE